MSSCVFLAADQPLTPLGLPCGTNDIYLHSFSDVGFYTDKKYAVSIEWEYSDEGACIITDYITAVLQYAPCVELWRVWLTDYYEFDDRPFVHKQSVLLNELTNEHIKAIDCADIWNTPDKRYPDRPSFYCLKIESIKN